MKLKGILVDSTVSVKFPMFKVESLSVVLALEAEVEEKGDVMMLL